MKFDFAIGNPPYQEEAPGQSTSEKPVYHFFMDAAFAIAGKVELIHPARFLFNAGSTPKPWNRKMLDDPHFKILEYEQDCKKMFSSTDIKGGVAISYRDDKKMFGPISIFTAFESLNNILHKVVASQSFVSFATIVISRTSYRLTETMHKKHPNAIYKLSNGHAYDMSTNIFNRLPEIFYDKRPNDEFAYIRILGREKNARVFKWVRKDFVNKVSNIDKFKVIMAKSNGTGRFGETFAQPIVGNPNTGHTETFLSIGSFNTEKEANNCQCYIRTKFARCMLGILKTTQDITPEKWKYVPLQDFTTESDIDWSKPIAEIDQQLYKKYKLTEKEIEFIETNVKEMG